MTPIQLQDALATTYKNASTKDKLKVVFGAMLANLSSKADYVDLINKQYSDDPVKGGSVHVDRIAFANVRNYGYAAANGYGDSVRNNGIDVLVNTDKEIIVEVPRKDAKLWRDGGEAEMLARTYQSMADALKIFLDDTYFVALQTAAVTYDTSGVVAGATALETKIKKILALIRKLESITGDNVNKVDRSLMVLTLSSEDYDDLETYMTNLTNPAGNSGKGFHEVEVRRALRQDVDSVIQVRGSMALPMVIDNYAVSKPPYKNALVQELYISYGLGAVMPECIFKASLSTDNSISI